MIYQAVVGTLSDFSSWDDAMNWKKARFRQRKEDFISPCSITLSFPASSWRCHQYLSGELVQYVSL